jgi:adenylate kinase
MAIFDPFSSCGLGAATKVLMLGSPGPRWGDLLDRARSLHLEHVSPALIQEREISRPPAAVPTALRRWFFARKPDAGFVLADFPATLLQALVFDEWLEARSERIDAVLAGPGAPAPVVAHYRDLGLVAEPMAEACS